MKFFAANTNHTEARVATGRLMIVKEPLSIEVQAKLQHESLKHATVGPGSWQPNIQRMSASVVPVDSA